MKYKLTQKQKQALEVAQEYSAKELIKFKNEVALDFLYCYTAEERRYIIYEIKQKVLNTYGEYQKYIIKLWVKFGLDKLLTELQNEPKQYTQDGREIDSISSVIDLLYLVDEIKYLNSLLDNKILEVQDLFKFAVIKKVDNLDRNLCQEIIDYIATCTNKQFTALAYFLYKPNILLTKPVTFAGFLKQFQSILGVSYRAYKPSAVKKELEEIRGLFYYLE